MRLADRGGLGAAGELAVLVALDDGLAQVGWDLGVGAPMSSGWLRELQGSPRVVARRQDASFVAVPALPTPAGL